jgi:O-antigen/teichoic acid export membrane protein
MGSAATAAVLGSILSSLSNLLVTSSAARSVGISQFGRFALVQALLLAAVVLSRVVIGQTMLLNPLGASHAWTVARIYAIAVGVVVCGVGLLAGLGASVAITWALGSAFCLAEDWFRFEAFARGRPGQAARYDAVWLTIQLCVLAFLQVSHTHLTLLTAVAAWTSGAAGALLFARSSTRPTEARRRKPRWLSTHRSVLRPLLMEASALVVSGQFLFPGLTLSCGSSCVAGYRGGQLLAAPTVLVFIGLTNVLPFWFRTASDGRDRRRRLYGSLTAVVAANLGWLAILLLVSDSLGPILLGQTWHLSKEVYVFVMINQLVASLGSFLTSYLRVSGRLRPAARVNSLTAPLEPAMGISFGKVGLVAAALGTVISQFIRLLALLAVSVRRAPDRLDRAPAE